MVKQIELTQSAEVVFKLFDEEERRAFLDEFDVTPEDVPRRFAAPQLLHWIVRRRSAFIRMAGDIGAFLTRIEKAAGGNIAFLVTEHQGRELEFHFGPQVRRQVAAALSWTETAAVDLDGKLTELTRTVQRFCADARPGSVRRDSSAGRMMRDMARMHPNPVEQMKYRMSADILRQSHREFHPGDVALIRQLAEQFDRAVPRMATMVPPASAAPTGILSRLGRLQGEVGQTARRAAARRSNGPPHPRASLDARDVTRIGVQLKEIEEGLAGTLTLASTGDLTVEAMALSFWKERWRLYELWLLCIVCALLTRSSDSFDLAGRVAKGRWTLKFSNDRLPVLTASVGGRYLDLYYQYFQPGDDHADMPDIAVRDRTVGGWLFILDPKSGLSFTRSELAKVCRRYSDAFDAGLSVVANYFPDAASVDDLAYRNPAFVFHGLRPDNVGRLNQLVAGALRKAGVVLTQATVVALVDVSGSMASHRAAISEALAARLRTAGDLDPDLSRLAFFAEDWLEVMPLEHVAERSEPIPAGGGNDYRVAIGRAVDYLEVAGGQRQIWLFGDGEDVTEWGDLVDRCAAEQIRFDAFVVGGGASPALGTACERTGGALVRIG